MRTAAFRLDGTPVGEIPREFWFTAYVGDSVTDENCINVISGDGRVRGRLCRLLWDLLLQDGEPPDELEIRVHRPSMDAVFPSPH